MIWFIILGVLLLGFGILTLFSMLKLASNADDMAEKLLNEENNTYKN